MIISGDLDGNLLPDAAFIAPRSVAEVVLNATDRLTKVQIDTGATAADVGSVAGRWPSIVVKKVGGEYVWSAVYLTGPVPLEPISKVAGTGTPVVGCYVENVYTPASVLMNKTTALLRLYGRTAVSDVSLPTTALSVRCGPPESGTSSVFYINKNKTRNTLILVAKRAGRVVLRSRLDSKLEDLSLTIVPRAENQMPTAMVLARLGTKQVIQVLDTTRRWRFVTMPAISATSTITGAVGIRDGASTYLILQVTSKSKVTSYIKVLIPARYLQSLISSK